jgi:hypothetical protein
MMAMVEAIPAEKYDWRPDPNARLISGVFVHVAAGNNRRSGGSARQTFHTFAPGRKSYCPGGGGGACPGGGFWPAGGGPATCWTSSTSIRIATSSPIMPDIPVIPKS